MVDVTRDHEADAADTVGDHCSSDEDGSADADGASDAFDCPPNSEERVSVAEKSKGISIKLQSRRTLHVLLGRSLLMQFRFIQFF
jgi:hypothetical protein